MAKLARKTLTLFGLSGGTTNFGQFGSQAASAPVETKDLPTIQALTAWVDGWQDAVALGEAPYLQDMNGVMYVHSYEQVYAFQEGVPEYDAGTTYYIGSVVKVSTNAGYVEFYCSLIDNSTGNTPPMRVTNGNWQYMFAINLGAGLILPGRLTATTPPAGAIGQLISSIASSAVCPTSGNIGDAATLALTAGDWTISANARFETGGGTQTAYQLGISITPGNSGTGLVNGDNDLTVDFASGLATFPLTIVDWPLQLGGNQTVYLKYGATYSGAAPVLNGRITARRAS